MDPGPDVHVAIVGAGFAGLGVAVRLRQAGITDFVVLERAGDVGGTWRDNTYPGVQCDVPSHLYSFSFAPNPSWSRTYSMGTEIQRYLRRVTDEHGVTLHLRLDTELLHAAWDDDARLWRLDTSTGPLTARIVVAALGPLSEPVTPDLPGLAGFRGDVMHTGAWRHDVPLEGRRIGVVGTGASAIQAMPELRRVAEHVTVFQRTPPWVLPHTDRPTSATERELFRRLPAAQRTVRSLVYASRELLVVGMTMEPRLLAIVERMSRRHLERQVADPELRTRLTPDYRIGCKRMLLSDDWYPAIASPDVSLVTSAVERLEPSAAVATDGSRHELDVLVFGTGFRVSDPPLAERLVGRGGRLLRDVWQGSPQAYLGTTVAGYPNLFTMVGPNTGLGHNSIVFMIEAQAHYVVEAVRAMARHGVDAIEVRRDVQERFNERVQRRLRPTVWARGGCTSWYIDANGRNSTMWPWSTWRFWQRTRRFDAASYHARRARSPQRMRLPS